MKKLLIIFILLLLLIPLSTYATCSKNGTTVVFLNGIFGEEVSARENKDLLEKTFKILSTDPNVTFINAFNPSHVAGVDDLAMSIIQAYRGGYTDFDLTTMLRQLHIDLKTQKIVLVGHSQGTFYTNAAYDYLINNGVDKSAIAVYNIGTPADRVAGGGRYLTSSTDEVINATIRGLANAGFANGPLPANIDIEIPNEPGVNYDSGHSFSKVYLGLAPERIITDIDQAINSLVANTDKEECFIQPEAGILYNVWDGGYTVIDNMGKVGKYTGTGNTPQVDAAIGYLFKGLFNFGKGIGDSFANLFNDSGFLGASLVSLPEQNISADSTFNPDSFDNTLFTGLDLLDYNGTGGPDEDYMAEQDMQDLLDDIQEKIDVISQQVQDLIAERDQENQQRLEENDQIVDEDNDNNNDNDNDNDNGNNDNSNGNNDNNGNNNGGGYVAIYPKILISEIKIAEKNGDKDVFIELYNPNNSEVNLTDWYIFRNDSSFITKSMLVGKKIAANGYFLLTKEGSIWDSQSNVLFSGTLNENDKISLKNPNGGSLTDEISWAQIADDLSFGRKWDSTNNTEKYFEFQSPTPKAQNITYVPIADIIAPVITLNSLSELTITIGDTYTDAGATAIDNVDGDITVNIVIVNPVDTNIVGDYIITYNISDLAGNHTTEVTRLVHVVLPELVDETAPQVTFNISTIQTDLTFPVSFAIEDPLIGTVSPSGIDSYVFRWQTDGGDWQEDDLTVVDGNPVSSDFSRIFTGQEGKIYGFQVKATDVSNNISEWLPKAPATTEIKLIPKVLINEIQIDSIEGSGGVEDDWVELYNPNDVEISLAGWSIQKHGKDSPCSINVSFYKKNFPVDAVISAHGYYLIVSTGANSNLKGKANMTIGWSLSEDSTVYLVKSNANIISSSDSGIVDRVGFGTACFPKINPAENPLDGQSIQRRWNTINNKTQDTGDNSVDFQIFSTKSTPKTASPKYYLYNNFTFTTDTILKKALGPYLFKGASVVSKGVTLTVEPGVAVKFIDSIITINGTLNAVGTTGQPIAFTSINDIDYGGDIRNDGDISPTSPGQWSGLTFSQSSINSDLENVVVRYAGGYIGGFIDAGISVNQSVITLKNSIIQSNVNGGLSLVNSASNIDSVQFLDNYIRTYDYRYGKAIFANGNNPIIKNCIFKNNYDSVYLANDTLIDSLPIVENNNFEDNHNAIYVSGKNIYPSFSGNSAINNYTNAIIFGVTISKNISIHKDLTYLIKYALIVPENITLTIEPGTVIKFADSIVKVDGTLNAVGTLAEPIVFTSVDDRDYGADVWPWNSTPVSPGQWSGILFNPTSVNSNLENIILRYAGGEIGGYIGAGIAVQQSSITLKNSIIQNNMVNGTFLVNSVSNIDSVQFLSNKLINCSRPVSGLYISGGNPTISNSYFAENNYGITWDGILPGPILADNSFSPMPNPFDLERVYGPNTEKDFYDTSLPK